MKYLIVEKIDMSDWLGEQFTNVLQIVVSYDSLVEAMDNLGRFNKNHVIMSQEEFSMALEA